MHFLQLHWLSVVSFLCLKKCNFKHFVEKSITVNICSCGWSSKLLFLTFKALCDSILAYLSTFIFSSPGFMQSRSLLYIHSFSVLIFTPWLQLASARYPPFLHSAVFSKLVHTLFNQYPRLAVSSPNLPITVLVFHQTAFLFSCSALLPVEFYQYQIWM